MSREELNRAPSSNMTVKTFVQDVARALIEKEVGLEAEETFTQSPTIYIPSSPDYARAVSSVLPGVSFLRRNAPKSSKRAPREARRNPGRIPLYWQRWNINSPVMETVTRRVHEAARGDLIY